MIMKQIKGWRLFTIIALAVVLLGTFVFIGQAFDKDTNQGIIGYIDIMRVSSEFKPFIDVQTQIDVETQKMQDKFDAESKNMKDEAKQELFVKYQNDLNKRISDLNLDQKMQEAQQSLFNTINKVAQEKGLSCVIDAGVIYYGNPAFDITDAVIEAGAKIK